MPPGSAGMKKALRKRLSRFQALIWSGVIGPEKMALYWMSSHRLGPQA